MKTSRRKLLLIKEWNLRRRKHVYLQAKHASLNERRRVVAIVIKSRFTDRHHQATGRVGTCVSVCVSLDNECLEQKTEPLVAVLALGQRLTGVVWVDADGGKENAWEC